MQDLISLTLGIKEETIRCQDIYKNFEEDMWEQDNKVWKLMWQKHK